MLAQRYRFHGHGSLKYVYRRGQAIRSRLITIKYARNMYRSSSRVSVVVSKKVLKSAVGRNRIRRRVYEIVRKELPQITENYDIVLLVFSSEVASLPSGELTEIIQGQLQEAGIIPAAPVKSGIITDDMMENNL